MSLCLNGNKVFEADGFFKAGWLKRRLHRQSLTSVFASHFTTGKTSLIKLDSVSLCFS